MSEEARPGPRLVRGVGVVVDSAGEASVAQRPVVALCTCGGTGRAPWCDATHKVIARKAAERAARLEQERPDHEQPDQDPSGPGHWR